MYYLLYIQIPKTEQLSAFDQLSPLAITMFFVITIVTGFLTRKIVLGRELDNAIAEREKEVASLKVQHAAEKAALDAQLQEAIRERKNNEAEIREIQDDFRRVTDDYKRLFDQIMYSFVGDALRKRGDGEQ